MAETIPCPHCSAQTASNSRFCSSCGSVISLDSAVAAAVAPPGERLSDSGAIQLKRLLEDAVGGEYIIHEELGRGGMAVVYRATEVHLARTVAIKVLPPDLTFAKGTTERFQREAKTAAALDHPNIIPIYRISSGGKLFWYAMKYLEGRSLGDVIQEKGILTLSETLAILEQVGSALDYAHQRGVIHRDIKPGNVMLDVNGRVTVTDFGIAKELRGSGLTGSDAILGTHYYMSPKQCRGSQELTGASDQYSLGVMTYQMITGQLPFEADSAIDVIHKHVSEPPPPIEKLLPGLPRNVINAVNRAMAKKPRERFPTVMGFVGALKNAPVDATLIVDGAALEARRSRKPARVAVLLGLMGIVAAATFVVYQQFADPQRTDLSAAPAASNRPAISAPGTVDSVSRSLDTVQPPPHPAATPRPAAPLPAPAPAPAPRPAASAGDSGTAAFSISPSWANISVAGQVLQERRITNVRLPAGSHTATFTRDGYNSVTRSFVVRPGQVTRVAVTMTPRTP